ncbi:ankyrin repeat-containing domain protein [Biscogniauxia mediterranea]|nr:ankyrin repeat-containing domain protein [Biscogniauxia mediterranea]
MCEDHILTFLSRPLAKPLATAKDRSGANPFQYALRNLRSRCCELLLRLGAGALERDLNGTTAMHHIASQWLCFQPEIPILVLWRRFISLGGSINVRDTRENLPLFAYLASSGPRLRSGMRREDGHSRCCHLEYFDVFFDAYGAELTLQNNIGQTALHIVAERAGREEIERQPEYDAAMFSFLIDGGLDPLAKDIDGKTSVDVARKLGKDEIVRLVEGAYEDVVSLD